jgi:hypothetical protein
MIITSSLILLIAFLVTTAVLAKTGVVYFGLKNQADKVQLINPACDNNIIQQYNQIYYQHSSGSRGALDETVQQIKLQNHWQQDPACLYIILQAELMNHNIDQARQLYSDYVKLLQDNHHGYSLALIEGFDGPKSIATFIESVAASPNNSDSDEE